MWGKAMLRRLFLTGVLALAAALAGCGDKPAFQGVDVTGSAMGGEFTLTDHNGKPRALSDFRGKVVVIFFGYTHCPDACPTTMSELAGALKQLGDRAREVQVLFITVDPERDTPELLSKYVPAFNPSFIGLYGTQQQTRTVADLFKVFYQKAANGADEKNYSMDHTAGSYILDKTGKLRLFMNYGAGAAMFAHDLGMLLAE